MQMVVDIKICSILVSRMVNIPILGHFHRYVRGIEVTILSNSAVKYNPNTTSLPFKWPLVYEPHHVLKRFTSELTSPSGDSLASQTEDSSVAVAGSFVHLEEASPVENKILEQLHRQTRLLLEMQRRIDDLSTTVEILSENGGLGATAGGGNNFQARQVPRREPDRLATLNPIASNWSQVRKPPTATATAAPPPARFARAATPEVRQQVEPPRPPGGAAQVAAGAGGGGLRGIPNAVRNSRLAKIVILFLALRRRYVQEIDGGLIFKILFMMAILTARMSSSTKRFGDPEWSQKFAIVTVLVVVGFLVQTGYMKYLYIFLVKENYPARIWNGEGVDDVMRNPELNNRHDPNNINNNQQQNLAPAVPQGQLPPNHPQNQQAQGGWRNTFLGGMIPQGDQGGLVGAVQDVLLLLGSFLLSVFPMWNPEGPPPPRRIPQPQPQQEPQHPHPGGLAAGPGEVQPPQDPVQPLDDSDDED
jgi:hypothetical protein